MTFDEFIVFRDVKIRDDVHKKVVKLFNPYLYSVSEDSSKLPKIISEILKLDLTYAKVKTACFNQIDRTDYPYKHTDFYILFNNGVNVYIYGDIPKENCVSLKSNQYAVFILGDTLSGNISSKDTNHIIIE